MNVKQFLQEHQVPFEMVVHAQTFDSRHLADAVGVAGAEVAKTVLVRADHGFRYVVAVLPATHSVDLEVLSQSLGGATVELATEQEVADRCPDCEFGALPPFGSSYGAQTIVDTALTDDAEIVFEGNTHTEAIRMRYQDYYEVEHPLIAQFARRMC